MYSFVPLLIHENIFDGSIFFEPSLLQCHENLNVISCENDGA